MSRVAVAVALVGLVLPVLGSVATVGWFTLSARLEGPAEGAPVSAAVELAADKKVGRWYLPAAAALSESFSTFLTIRPVDTLPPELTPLTTAGLAGHACYRVRAGRNTEDLGDIEVYACFYDFDGLPEVFPVTRGGVSEGRDLFPSFYPSTCLPQWACWGRRQGAGPGPLLGPRRLVLIHGGTIEQRAVVRAVIAPFVPDTPD
jgi:hypothetical protein